MRLELLAFDLLLIGPPVVASFRRSTFFLDRWRWAWASAAVVGLPALVWLAWMSSSGGVIFSPAHSLVGTGLSVMGLPLGAIFLVPAIAFACLFCWRVGFAEAAAAQAPKPWQSGLHAVLLVALAAGVMGLVGGGPRHAQLALLAVGLLSPLDLALRTKLVARAQFWAMLAAVVLLTLVFGGALIQRGIVAHSADAIVGFALIGVPIEDLGYALALAGAAVLVFAHLEQRAAASASKGLIARLIERRFGGYRQLLHPIDEQLPLALTTPRKVAVIGAGLAGIGAATKLAERGFAVTLLERNDYIGGKLGAWKTTMPDGREIGMDHGFHAFFHQYYNLNAFFKKLGLDRSYRNIGDYMILAEDGQSYSFKAISTTPLLNLLSLARHGVYDLREVSGRETGLEMEALLRYDPTQTYATHDEISFASFSAKAKLPASLGLVFNTFSRVFFADPDKMSMAELIKSFHFYYLSNDCGLIYEYVNDDFGTSLLGPLREYMQGHGVDIRTGCEIRKIEREAEGGFEVDGERFDYVVIASDVVGTRALFERSPSLAAAAPKTAAKVATLEPGQPYSVFRLWLDRGVNRELPGFVITERVRLLDSITLMHQIQDESANWVAQREAAGERGAVVELHCYAIPEDLYPSGAVDEAQLRELFLAELHHFLPELADAVVIHEHLYVRRDFPAFHVGKHATRPGWETDLDNLFLAGDWVVLPFPAMLMEAAYSAGLLAANRICRAESLREEQVWTVPQRGFMAGWPKRPF
ncbi:Phytoene desaturase [Enhygromyxa salina]|uniref:Phytoene desaturase n=1 Tax=Enhygromyxa salina TaxID=215803 RepID=A0A0C2CVV5_9BACT|nr:FAD-dependent oxidoreductase [Enhygromyxa salina]KIG12007.1 Phytoene desaturase [Enhygromyxa salina]